VDDADSFFEPKPLSTVLVDAFQRRNVNRPQERVRREKENERHACRWSALRMIAYRVTQNSGRSQWLASAPRNWVWRCLLILSCRTSTESREGDALYVIPLPSVGEEPQYPHRALSGIRRRRRVLSFIDQTRTWCQTGNLGGSREASLPEPQPRQSGAGR